MNLFTDIETIPANEEITEEDLRAALPANIKAEKTILDWLENRREELVAKIVKKRSIDKYLCRIISIAYSFDGENVFSITNDDEATLMELFDKALTDELGKSGGSANKFHIIGHNVDDFDLPILFLRAAKYGSLKLHELLFFNRRETMDTMKMGSYWKFKEYVSLKDLCRFFGRDTKDDMDGSKVYEYYKEGRLEEIGKYCEKDVEDTIFLYKKLHIYE